MMSDTQEDTVYYLRFIAMFIDIGTETVLKVFYNLTPKQELKAFFTKPEIENILKSKLLRNKILTCKEYRLVSSSKPNPDHFDTSLLITLLTNLYSGNLAAPKNGWTSPNPGDLSIAADLVRLQDIRNTIVAHKPQAKLCKGKFEYMWNRVEEILVRLVQQVDSNSEIALKEKLAIYKDRPLDQHNEAVCKYVEKLQEWWENCEEISKLQEKVEELVKKTQDFVLFFKKKPERYSRYIKLLFDGGQFVLRGIVDSEIAKRNQTLETVLVDNKDLLKEKFANEEMFEQLFVETADNTVTTTDAETWDIIVLSVVIINIFCESVDDVIAVNITTIMEARIQYANNALVALDSERFNVCCEDLISSIRVLSSRLGSNIYKKCNEVIAEYRDVSDGHIGDVEHYLEMLKKHGSQIQTIAEVYMETLATLKTSVKKMEDEGVIFKRSHVLELKMVTLGDNKQKKKVAEDALETVWQAALKMSDNPTEFEDVRKALNKILEDIRKIPDVEVKDVERHCILLKLRCQSWRGLLQLLGYLESTEFQQHLRSIADSLSFMYGALLHIVGHLTIESILNVSHDPEPIHDEPGPFLSLPIQCRSAESMRKVLEVLGNESTINRFNEIADSISANVEDTVTLDIKTDVKGFNGVFEETDSTELCRMEPKSLSEPSSDLLPDDETLCVEFKDLSTPEKRKLPYEGKPTVSTDEGQCFKRTAEAVKRNLPKLSTDEWQHFEETAKDSDDEEIVIASDDKVLDNIKTADLRRSKDILQQKGRVLTLGIAESLDTSSSDSSDDSNSDDEEIVTMQNELHSLKRNEVRYFFNKVKTSRTAEEEENVTTADLRKSKDIWQQKDQVLMLGIEESLDSSSDTSSSDSSDDSSSDISDDSTELSDSSTSSSDREKRKRYAKRRQKRICKKISLVKFLWELLDSETHMDIIQWTNNDGEFKIIKTEKLARLWGHQKRMKMNYKKLSRALRNTCPITNQIQKRRKRKHVYKFVSFTKKL